MSILRSFASAFLMYSRIPMPHVEWKEENRRYALCFFPLIGAVIAAFLVLWHYISLKLGVGRVFFAAVGTALPLLITGGIHMDGYMDVWDAKSSFGDREKLFEIMKDSHVGAFAVMHMGLYILIQFGAFTEVYSLKTVIIAGLIFIQSRALSALAAVTFKNARGEGSLAVFVKPAHRRVTIAVECIYIAAVWTAMFFICYRAALGAAAGAVLSFIYYRLSSYKSFGGITGDLAGWFLQICELSSLVLMALAAKI